MTPATTQKPAKTVEVKLLKPHTHGGRRHNTGATIEVAESLLPWLRAQDIIGKEA